MTNAVDLFESSLRWLENNYGRYNFFAERDIVWTLQLRLIQIINDNKLEYRVFNNYTMLPRGPFADLAIVANDGAIELAIEFKYEPSHNRIDIPHKRLEQSVVFWKGEGSVEKDIIRVKEYVDKGIAKAGYSVLFDEDGYWKRKKEAFPGSIWSPVVYASPYKLSLLISKVPWQKNYLYSR